MANSDIAHYVRSDIFADAKVIDLRCIEYVGADVLGSPLSGMNAAMKNEELRMKNCGTALHRMQSIVFVRADVLGSPQAELCSDIICLLANSDITAFAVAIFVVNDERWM